MSLPFFISIVTAFAAPDTRTFPPNPETLEPTYALAEAIRKMVAMRERNMEEETTEELLGVSDVNGLHKLFCMEVPFGNNPKGIHW